MKLKQVFGTKDKEKLAPTISFTYANGRLSLDKNTVTLLGLAPGNHLTFYQDEENPLNWYFAKGESRGSVALRAEGQRLMAYNAGIARRFMRAHEEYDSATYLIGKDLVGHKYYSILQKIEK